MLSTFTVTDTYDDTNMGSLRWAIGEVDADTNPGVDTIDFAITGQGQGPFTIYTYSPLPPLTHPVLIDGYSQSGASVNTQTTSDNAVLMIDLDGTYTYSPTYGLDIAASGCTVQGLAITDYASGVVPDSGTSGSIIQGNFIGTDVTGSIALGNSEGVLFQGSSDNTIGGTTPAAVNIISGNTGDEISLSNQTGNAMYNDTGNVIEGNYIGLTASATSTLATANNGVNLFNAYDNIIGGSSAGAGNVIAGQLQNGILINESNYNVVAGNEIGTDPTGTIRLGNSGPGILIGNASLGNTIGGTTIGAGNTIAFNSGDGVQVGYYSDDGSDDNVIQSNAIFDNSGAGVDVGSFSGDTTTGDAILSNSIYGNSALGIDLGDDYITQNSPGGPHFGPNDLQNYPVLTAAATFNGSTYVAGTLNSTPDATFTLQFFSNASPDPTGYGEGQTLIGTTTVSTDANGNASFSASFPGTIPTGESVSATATDSNGDTSEFKSERHLLRSQRTRRGVQRHLRPVCEHRDYRAGAGGAGQRLRSDRHALDRGTCTHHSAWHLIVPSRWRVQLYAQCQFRRQRHVYLLCHRWNEQLQRGDGNAQRESGVIDRDQHQRQRAGLAPPGPAGGQPLHQYFPRQDPLQDPGDWPVHDPARHAVADDHPPDRDQRL